MKNIAKKIHLYLSIISGVFILLIAISGIIYVFNDQIIQYANKEALHVEISQKERIETDRLLQTVRNTGYQPLQFVFYKAADRSFYVVAEDVNENFVQLYINPYTGKIIKTSGLYDFFYKVESFHTELFAGAAGRAFIGFITMLFLILIITGLILWYPKKWNSKTFRNSFIPKVKGRFQAVNYNLHKILGFYIIIPCLILSITGIIMAFDPIEITILNMAGKDIHYESYVDRVQGETLQGTENIISYEALVQQTFDKYPVNSEIRMTIPPVDNPKYILCETGDNFGMKYADNYTFSYIDRGTGEILNLQSTTSQSLNLKRIISELHTGKLFGIPYLIILFLTGIIVFSLPVTGFIIWHKRTKRKSIR